jgi:hypothetical protein
LLVEELDVANLYLPVARQIRVSRGGGELEVAVVLDQGLIGAGSSMSYVMTTPLRIEVAPLKIVGRINLSATTAPSQSTMVSVDAPRSEIFLLSGERDEVLPVAVVEPARWVSEFSESDLNKPLVRTSGNLTIDLVANRLEELDSLVPSPKMLRLAGGSLEASASAKFGRVGLERVSSHATFGALRLALGEHEIWAYGQASGTYSVHPETQLAQLDEAEIQLSNAVVRSGSRTTTDWWASIRTDKMLLDAPLGQLLGGTIVSYAKNSDPVLDALDVPEIVRVLVPNRPLAVSARLGRRGEVDRIELIRAETGNLSVQGEAVRDATGLAGVFRVGGIAVPVGIVLEDLDSSLTLFASTRWFDEELQALRRKHD